MRIYLPVATLLSLDEIFATIKLNPVIIFYVRVALPWSCGVSLAQWYLIL